MGLVKTNRMTESQLRQVIEYAHQAGQRNAGIDASSQAAVDYYKSLVQDGVLSDVNNCDHRARQPVGFTNKMKCLICGHIWNYC